jgi:hypothetical protein
VRSSTSICPSAQSFTTSSSVKFSCSKYLKSRILLRPDAGAVLSVEVATFGAAGSAPPVPLPLQSMGKKASSIVQRKIKIKNDNDNENLKVRQVSCLDVENSYLLQGA